MNAVLIQKAEHCRNEILGLSWDVETDESKEIITVIKSLPPIRRSVLKISTKLFPVLGIISPFVREIKVLL